MVIYVCVFKRNCLSKNKNVVKFRRNNFYNSLLTFPNQWLIRVESQSVIRYL